MTHFNKQYKEMKNTLVFIFFLNLKWRAESANELKKIYQLEYS